MEEIYARVRGVRSLGFNISDFVLGALFASIMATIALLFAFPYLAGDWFWWALVFVALIAWAIGAAILAAPSASSENDQESNDPGSQAQDDKAAEKFPISADAAAVVYAINKQERANREQEKREDERRRRIEVITLLIIIGTALALFVQIREMEKVYEPIRDQAQTTKDNMVADHRAWIGVTGGAIDAPVIDKPMHVRIVYGNTGRQPAPLAINTSVNTSTVEEWSNGKAAREIMAEHDKCFAIKEADNPVIVAFPTSPPAGYTRDFSTVGYKDHTVLADQDIISGTTLSQYLFVSCIKVTAT